jgi:hypothetical protein
MNLAPRLVSSRNDHDEGRAFLLLVIRRPRSTVDEDGIMIKTRGVWKLLPKFNKAV